MGAVSASGIWRTVGPRLDYYVYQGPSYVNLNATMQTIMTSASLPPGEYEVSANLVFQSVTGFSTPVQVTAQISSPAGAIENGWGVFPSFSTGTWYVTVAVRATVILTSAGTINLNGQCSNGSGLTACPSFSDTSMSIIRIK